MRRRLTAAAFALVASTTMSVSAQQLAPRDIWPQATAAARDGDLDLAARKKTELITVGRTFGIRTFPVYATAASAMAGEWEKDNPELAKWAEKAAGELDPRSPSVAFSDAERAARARAWSRVVPLALQGFARVFGNYRTSVLGSVDALLVAAAALFVTAIVFAMALVFRYGRAAAHDFREILSARFRGGSVSVLAFALLFLPIFLWLGPLWLVFYWFAIFFGYAGWAERAAIVVLLILSALLPMTVDTAAHRIAGANSPVIVAAVSSADQAYQPDALRRLQELAAVVPDDATLQVLMGNLQAFEGADDVAAVHYRRAVELQARYAGAHVNLGNLLFLNNEFQAAITEYTKAEQADPKLAIAYYNHSVAAGETYKFDLQAKMLERARAADRKFVERTTRNPPQQKIVMYKPPIDEARGREQGAHQRQFVGLKYGRKQEQHAIGSGVGLRHRQAGELADLAHGIGRKQLVNVLLVGLPVVEMPATVLSQLQYHLAHGRETLGLPEVVAEVPDQLPMVHVQFDAIALRQGAREVLVPVFEIA